MPKLAAYNLARWLMLCLSLALVGMAHARDGDDLNSSCFPNWQSRLEGHTVYGVNVWDGTKIQAYVMPKGRVLWTQDGVPFVQDDSWSIRDCDTLCWELDSFDDLCSHLVASFNGVDLHDPADGVRIFAWTIASKSDELGLRMLRQSQRGNILANIINRFL